MENCIVCLESDVDVFTRITTESSEWIAGRMQKIIEKHLWWWYVKPPFPDNEIVPWICCRCWREISTFHEFYNKVEKAHRNYQPILTSLNQINMKNQEVCIDNLETDENVLPSTHVVMIESGQKQELEDIVKTEYELNECYTNEEYTVDIVRCEDMCAEDYLAENYSRKNIKMEIKEEKQLKNKLNIIRSGNKMRRKTKGRSKEKVQKKTKTNQTEKYNTDNFFSESLHKLQCCICNVALLEFRSLKEHYRNEHKTRGYFMCCGKKYFKRCLLVDHLKVHDDPNFFKCKLCTKTFSSRRGLELHLETHKIREPKYNCEECGKPFYKLHVFERHKLTHVPESEKNFECSQCNKKFASDYLRRQHEDSTHAKKYAKICDICGKSFCHGDSFLRHMEEHAGKPRSMATCGICGVKLTNKYGLRQHMKWRHLEENLQEQVCPFCSRVSPNLNAHRMHIKYSHTMQRKHACHLCDKAFRRPLELREHLCTHTGETLYTCPHCPRTFISNANMHKHRKIVHRMEWEESRLKKLNNSGGKTESISTAATNKREIEKSVV